MLNKFAEIRPNAFAICLSGGEVLLKIKPDGTVEAPSIEAASQAGSAFVEAIREQLKQMLAPAAIQSSELATLIHCRDAMCRAYCSWAKLDDVALEHMGDCDRMTALIATHEARFAEGAS